MSFEFNPQLLVSLPVCLRRALWRSEVGLGTKRLRPTHNRQIAKLCFFLLIGLHSTIAFSQAIPSRPNKTDEQKRRQGAWVILFNDSWEEVSDPLQTFYYRLISYRDDLPQGKSTDFFRNGVRQWEGTLIKDRPEVFEGVQTWYYENGNKRIEEIFNNNEPTGSSLAFLRNGEPANPLWKVDIYDKAYEAFEKNDFKLSAELYEKSLEHVEALLAKETEEYADILIWLTIVYHKLDDKQAMLQYNLALESVYKVMRAPTDEEYLTTVFDVARSYKFLDQWEESEEWYDKYFRLESKNGPHHSRYGLALSGISDVYMETQRYSSALDVLHRAKEFYAKNPPKEPIELELVSLHLRRANTLTGHWTDGKKLLLGELKDLEKQKGKNSDASASALSALGSFYKMNGQLREAETCYLEAINIMGKIKTPDPMTFVSACIPLIEVYYQLGQPQSGDTYIKQAKTALANFDRKSPGFNLLYTGFLKRATTFYEMMGNKKELDKTLAEWKIFTKESFGSHSIEYVYSLMAQGEHQIKQRQYTGAESTLTEAEKAIINFHPSELSSSDVRLVAKVYQLLGTIKLLQGDTGQATKNYFIQSNGMYSRLAEQGFIPEQVDVFLALAVLNEMNGNEKEADVLYNQCLQLVRKYYSVDHINYATILFAIAKKSEIRKNIQASHDYYKEALTKLTTHIASVFPYLSIEEKELFYQANTEWIHNFQSFAINNYESMPVLSDELYNLQLATKGIVLQSVGRVRQRIMAKGSDQLKADYDNWRSKKNELITSYRQGQPVEGSVDKLLEEINSLEKKLSEQSEDFLKWNVQKKIEWRDVQKQLKENEAAIEFLYVKREITNDSLYIALIIRKDSSHPSLVKLSDAGELEGKRLKFYRNAALNQLEDKDSYNYYWKPLTPHLEKISRAFVSADGIFHQINLATLYNPETKHYLLDNVEVRLVPSTSLLIAIAEQSKSFKKVALIAHPDYGSKQLKSSSSGSDLNRSFDLDNVADLPGTEGERQELSELFHQNKIPFDEFSSTGATEEALKSIDNPSVLHIATHGFFLSDQTISGDDNGSFFGFTNAAMRANSLLRSGLLLAGCQNQLWKKGALSSEAGEDGILTAFEASTLRLDQTQLVVLSACETGLGEIRNGEGVYGLQRAFVMAGARQVLMSLWKVDDKATQEFMVAFYSELLKSHDAGNAFLKAQTSLKVLYPSPYYWGAFVLTGL